MDHLVPSQRQHCSRGEALILAKLGVMLPRLPDRPRRSARVQQSQNKTGRLIARIDTTSDLCGQCILDHLGAETGLCQSVERAIQRPRATAV